MSDNPAKDALVLLIGLMVIGAVGLAFAGFDPTIATDLLLPLFLIAVFVAIAINFVNTAIE